MAPASHGLLGRLQKANGDRALQFGPHSGEVEAFIEAAAGLTPWQWRQVLAARRLVASVTKEGAGQPADSAKSIQASTRSSETRISEPMARAGEALFEALARKSEEKQVAAWQAMSALVMRARLPAVKFAVHYAPFAAQIPLFDPEMLDSKTRSLIRRIEFLTAPECEALALRRHIDPAASHALVRAVAKNREHTSEEAVALAALTVVSQHATGDLGWAAVRTLVHGGRVVGCLSDLTSGETTELWSPLEATIALASLDAPDTGPPPKAPRRSPRIAPADSAVSAYGPNSVEVATFIKEIGELSPIQWLRVLDRRKLVASVTREGSAEPAGVVRSILAAIERTRDLDLSTRCRAFAAVERAGYALETPDHMRDEQLNQLLRPFRGSIRFQELNGSGFAHKVVSLSSDDWRQIAAASPEASEAAVAPLINAGDALVEFFSGRSDDETVAAWHAVSALVRRHQLTPIKFAASYAPFASAIPVTKPRALGAMVSRYVTAVGRLGANHCALLAKPWQIDDEHSNALSRLTADGSARAAEEAAALAAVVTVPMRLPESGGWAAVKTAAFGGRVIASRARLTPEQLEALWKPIQPAISLASLSAPAKSRR